MSQVDDEKELLEANEASEQEQNSLSAEEKKGYRGYEEWVDEGGDPEAFQGRKAYDAYGKLLKEVRDLRKDIKGKDTALENMAELFRKEEERIKNKYAQYYQQQQYRLNEAEQMGDVATVRDATQEMFRTEQSYNNEVMQARATQSQQLIKEFQTRNSDWYNAQHPELVAKAQQLAMQYEREYPHLAQTDPVYLLNKIESEIRTQHRAVDTSAYSKAKNDDGADYSISPSRSAVNKSGAPSTAKVSSLNNEQRQEFKEVQAQMKELGIEYTVEDYLGFQDRNKA